MRKYIFPVLLPALLLFFASCTNDKKPDAGKMRDEIAAAEKAFETMAAEKGIAEAFWFYADPGAVIKRQNDTLITGKENIRNYYAAERYQQARVSWSPDFIDVAGDGDMAYTYGKYTWTIPDSSGNPVSYNGVFHTVWKRQADGSWKYVWD